MMSLLLSLLKSFVLTIVQLLGTAPRAPDCKTCMPFSNQIATVPVLPSRQRMSALPSPLKSPVPTIVQLLGTAPRLPDCTTCKPRSEEHTSELQSHHDLVCRLLLEKKKKKHTNTSSSTTQKRKLTT